MAEVIAKAAEQPRSNPAQNAGSEIATQPHWAMRSIIVGDAGDHVNMRVDVVHGEFISFPCRDLRLMWCRIQVPSHEFLPTIVERFIPCPQPDRIRQWHAARNQPSATGAAGKPTPAGSAKTVTSSPEARTTHRMGRPTWLALDEFRKLVAQDAGKGTDDYQVSALMNQYRAHLKATRKSGVPGVFEIMARGFTRRNSASTRYATSDRTWWRNTSPARITAGTPRASATLEPLF